MNLSYLPALFTLVLAEDIIGSAITDQHTFATTVFGSDATADGYLSSLFHMASGTGYGSGQTIRDFSSTDFGVFTTPAESGSGASFGPSSDTTGNSVPSKPNSDSMTTSPAITASGSNSGTSSSPSTGSSSTNGAINTALGTPILGDVIVALLL